MRKSAPPVLALICGIACLGSVLAGGAGTRAETSGERAGASGEPAPERRPGGPPPKFNWRSLADGVWLVEANSMGSNSMVVIGDSTALLVDTQIAPSAAGLLLDELAERTSLPVSHAVNTHWHVDHIGGNEAVRRRFPGVKIVAHVRAPAGAVSGGPDQKVRAASFWRESLGERLRPVDRASLAELEAPYTFEPDLLVDDKLWIDLGGKRVEVTATPGGHTGGDLIVYLPEEKIAAGGDATLPQLFGSQGYPARHARTLRLLAGMQPVMVIPGHGPPQEGTALIHRQADQLEALIRSVKTAHASGEKDQALVARLAPEAGDVLGDAPGLIRAILREMESSL